MHRLSNLWRNDSLSSLRLLVVFPFLIAISVVESHSNVHIPTRCLSSRDARLNDQLTVAARLALRQLRLPAARDLEWIKLTLYWRLHFFIFDFSLLGL